jgi:hypothetical protein
MYKNNCPICRKEFYHISEDELAEMENEVDDEDMEYTPDGIIYFIGNIGSYSRDFIDRVYFEWYMVERFIPDSSALESARKKLPKNINMRYKKRHYRFDNTNYDHVATRY